MEGNVLDELLASSLGRIGWIALAGDPVFSCDHNIVGVYRLPLPPHLNRDAVNTSNTWSDSQVIWDAACCCIMAARSAGLISQEKERDCWMSVLADATHGSGNHRRQIVGQSLRCPVDDVCPDRRLAAGHVFFTPTVIVPLTATCLMFFLLAFYVTCLGLYFSLRSTTTLRAMGQTLGNARLFRRWLHVLLLPANGDRC